MIPKELRDRKQWVNYLLVPDPESDKPKKKPINPLTGNGAMSNNAATWTDYDTAVDALERYNFSGLGYMFVKGDDIVGVDIDHCYDPETKTFNEVATAIIAHQPTYAEFSPSGMGVHLFYKGTKPAGGSKNTENGVEMYDSGRYFTMTGKQLEGAPDEIADGNETLAWIHETYIKKQKKPREKKGKKKKSAAPIELTDEELIEKASSSEGGDMFADLFSGNWQSKYQSQSEADMALCMKLAFWSGKNREQMERLFKSSGLYRQKWDEQHHADGMTYGEETLNRAMELVEDVYTPATGDDPVFEFKGRYWSVKGENTYPLTNFVIEPIEMIKADEDTQLTADLVTVRGEKFRLSFMTSDFANLQRFKNLLNKNTIALSYLGGEGDLELLKGFVSSLEWTVKFGVKAMGIYNHESRLVFVSKDGAIEKDGIVVDNIVQLEKYKSK